MGEFLHKYNTDNVHSRAVIVGIVNLLNSKVFFENVLSDTVVDTVYVPFFYNMGGDERFLQDYFLEWNDCINPRHADGNYDVIPRGIVTMTSKTIDTAKLTHRFVRATFVKEVNGQLQQFNSFLNSLPISMSFSVEVEVDSNLDAFKVEQAIMETFYKTQVFSVNFRGFRVPCQAGFADDYGVEKTFEFSYQSDNKILVKFDIEVETYYPVLDPTTERSNSNRTTSGWAISEQIKETSVKPRFLIESPLPQEKYFSAGILPISWTNTGQVLNVDIYYRIAGTEEWILIVRNTKNTGYYDWQIPFFNNEGLIIPYEPQVATVPSATGRGAHVRALADSSGAIEQIIVFNRGLSYSAVDQIEVNIYPRPTTLPPDFTAPVIQANVIDGEIMGYNIVETGSGFTSSPITEIEIKIESTVDPTVFSEITETIEFSGNTDGSSLFITNVIPTVSSLLEKNSLLGLAIEGIGVQSGSLITSVDPVQNRIGINISTTAQVSNEPYRTAAATAKITIQ